MTDESLIKWLPIFGEFVILALIIMIVLGFMVGYIKPTVGGYATLVPLVFFLLMLHTENVKHFNKNEQDN
jgi:hypothetical protein